MNGTNNSVYTLHNLQRTVAAIFGAVGSGSGANTTPITGVFTTDAPQKIVTFQQGTSGYASQHDTQLSSGSPSTTFGSTTPLNASLNSTEGLIRFDSVFGNTATQVPLGATILSAKLMITTNTTSTGTVELHRMLKSWDENSTWNSMTGGISADGVEANAASDFTLMPNQTGNSAIFDVTSSLQAWSNGTTNNGWAILANSSSNWAFDPAEFGTIGSRPTLEVTFAVPEPGTLSLLALAAAATISRRSRHKKIESLKRWINDQIFFRRQRNERIGRQAKLHTIILRCFSTGCLLFS